MSEQQDAIHAARQMTASLDRVSERLEQVRRDSEARDAALARYGRRSRRMVRAAIVSLIADIALTVAVTVALIGVHSNGATITDLRGSQIRACQANNTRLARQRLALDSVLTRAQGTVSPAERKAERAFLHRAEAYIAAGWGSRDCTALYRTAVYRTH